MSLMRNTLTALACAALLSTVVCARDAFAGTTDADEVSVAKLPAGKTMHGARLGTLTYSVYEYRKGKWQLRSKDSASLGDCSECTRGIQLVCAPNVAKAECKRHIALGAALRIDGDRFEHLSLTIKNKSRLRVARPDGNTSWPLELVLYEAEIDEALASAVAAKREVKPADGPSMEAPADKTQIIEKHEKYKIVLDVSKR